MLQSRFLRRSSVAHSNRWLNPGGPQIVPTSGMAKFDLIVPLPFSSGRVCFGVNVAPVSNQVLIVDRSSHDVERGKSTKLRFGR